VANLGEVLIALGQVAGTLDRAGNAVGEADAALNGANTALSQAVAGSNNRDAREATEYLAIAISKTAEADQLLRAITGAVVAMAERIRSPTASSVPSGARAARAPVAGRAHPVHVPPPPAGQRDEVWAAGIGAQLAEFAEGRSTEALVFDAAGQDWQVNSGVDPALTAAAEAAIERMIANGEVGASANAVTNNAERTAVRRAATHAETKAAVWAAANGKQDIDVVTNRDFVCGDTYKPGDRQNPPGCAQAVAAILPIGYRMRVWRRGVAVPLVIMGRGGKG
jgi:hypothetical protein